MTDDTRDTLIRQLDIAWELTHYHLKGLSTEECLWRPARVGLHMVQEEGGMWRGEWPEHEEYTLGPPSIAWLVWHLGFWWSMVLDQTFGGASLDPNDIAWPGSAERSREWIADLAGRWRAEIEPLTPADLHSLERTRWPFTDRPLADIVAWANIELMKSAAEIGYARFLYAVRPGP